MNRICIRCQSPNPDEARFCRACGATLGATMVRGHTVVVGPPGGPSTPPGHEAVTPSQLQTIVAKANETFGAGPVPRYPTPMSQVRSQREHTVLVNDASSSMGEIYDGSMTKLQASKRASVTLVVQKAQIDPQDEVGLVMFRSDARAMLDLSPIQSHKRQIIQAIQSLTPENGTDINEGLKAAHDMFDWGRKGVVRRIILLTDGEGGDPLRTARDLKGRGVIIDVIGVGPSPRKVDEKLLKKVASEVEGELRYRFIKDQQTLVAHYTQLAGKTAIGS